ncbi:stage II sporulation protein M [Marininema halotolerans]|uniref:Stage II sporulation protein M n=1 Tax=Marininema halotolerans TaxID=1155944 RepID=A0A1I6T497_9BACL|nr:stage II sporulation protein M [Marininema halotolerans]SFS84089.1 stage II sporulation protein M [Marininema halotolerans]
MNQFVIALREERRLIRLATVLLVGGALLGYLFADSITGVLKSSAVWEQLQETVSKMGKHPGFFDAFTVIWLNNMKAAATMIGMGVFFGVFPLFALLTNGVILGVVLGQVSAMGNNPLWVFVTKILPHGILELPALIIASAFGIRLGLLVLQWMISWVSPVFRERNQLAWQHFFRQIPYIVGGVFVLILVAAVIESGLIVYLKS